MTIQEQAITDSATETTEAKKEPVYTQSQLDAIIARKQSKFEKQLAEMQEQLAQVTAQYGEAQAKAEKGLSAEERLAKMEKDYKRQLENIAKEKADILAKHKNKIIDNELLKLASKSSRPEIVAKLLRDKVQIDDNDKVFAVNEYDTPISLEELSTDFFKKYPEFLPAPTGGSGTTQSKATSLLPNTKIVNWQDAVNMAAKLTGNR